jgi:group I intron endonuclease
MYGIYKITNNLDNKVYIGKSSMIENRWDYHRKNYENPTDWDKTLYKAFRKYGLENFSFEILEEIETNDLDLVDSREVYWIKKLSSHVKTGKGYNLTLGGQSLGRHKEITEEKVRLVVKLLGENQLTQKAIAE